MAIRQGPWSEGELRFLSGNYARLTHQAIADRLHRKKKSVGDKCEQMGWVKGKGNSTLPNPCPGSNHDFLPAVGYLWGCLIHGPFAGSDGFLSYDKKRKTHTIRLQVTDRDFAESFRDAIRHAIGKKPCIREYPRSDKFCLYRQAEVRRFAEEIGFTIGRKQRVLNEHFGLEVFHTCAN